jgi:hypothetical protein
MFSSAFRHNGYASASFRFPASVSAISRIRRSFPGRKVSSPSRCINATFREIVVLSITISSARFVIVIDPALHT